MGTNERSDALPKAPPQQGWEFSSVSEDGLETTSRWWTRGLAVTKPKSSPELNSTVDSKNCVWGQSQSVGRVRDESNTVISIEAEKNENVFPHCGTFCNIHETIAKALKWSEIQ